MRIQLAVPHNHLVSPQTFNRMFTMHGTTMVFFVGMPLLFGFANYLVPLMIGARDMAFPRLNAFSFWMTALGGSCCTSASSAAAGCTARAAPRCGLVRLRAADRDGLLSAGTAPTTGRSALLVSGFGSIGTAINIIDHDPLHALPRHDAAAACRCWSGCTLVMSGLVLVAISPLTAAQIMLLIDRYLGGHFFDTQAGGSASSGCTSSGSSDIPRCTSWCCRRSPFVNEIIPVFSRKAIFGYPAWWRRPWPSPSSA